MLIVSFIQDSKFEFYRRESNFIFLNSIEKFVFVSFLLHFEKLNTVSALAVKKSLCYCS